MAVLKVVTALCDVNPMDFLEMRAAQCRGQQWFYVLLNNHHAPTPAGKELMENLNLLDLDSDDACNYFLAGYQPHLAALFDDIDAMMAASFTGAAASAPSRPDLILDRVGPLMFNDAGFVKICKIFERITRRAWRYSGECELLMFSLKEDEQDAVQLDAADFFAYNLDDIVRNNRTVAQFLRVITMAAEDGLGKEETKRIIDEKYADLILPNAMNRNEAFESMCAQRFSTCDYAGTPYWFLSYSVRDFDLVNSLRQQLEKEGVRCWMAPFSIPDGTNYAYMIELAIKHAHRFVLFLSDGAVNSVWVGKELKRAISRFQQKQAEKMRVIWCNGPVTLADTPLALPLEDIQIRGDLKGSADAWKQLME